MKSTSITVKLADLPAVKAVVRKADELAQAIEHADKALLEPHIREAHASYVAVRQEWKP